MSRRGRYGGYSGYGGYQGKRRPAGAVLRRLLTVLVVLLLLVAVGLLLGQRYIVYTDQGVRLDLPFFRREQPPAAQPPASSSSVPVEIVETQRPDPPPAVEPPPEEEVEPPALPEPTELRAVQFTLEELIAGGPEVVRAQGANTAVIEMKRPDGKLAYVSGLPLGQSVSAGEDQVTGVLSALHEAGIRAVARVCCFRDNALGGKTAYALLTNSGYRWKYDDVGLYWSNPANEEVRVYLAGVAGELAALGFDEILLDHCGYPVQGELGWIRPGENYDRAQVAAFLEQASQALEGTSAELSVFARPEAVNGTDKRSGLNAQLLSGLSGQVWLTAPTEPKTEGLRLVYPIAVFIEEEKAFYLTPAEEAEG